MTEKSNLPKKSKKEILLLIFLIVLLFSLNYSFLNGLVENFLQNRESAFVIRIIDGDTIEIGGGEKVRLLGIDAPEKGEKYSIEATKFLEEEILNKTVELEISRKKYDRYKRILAYIYVRGKNVNLELVENGLANVYLLDERLYEKQLRDAWESCRIKDINLCEKSKEVCALCIELKEFDYKNGIVVLYNKCFFDCNLTGWKIRDEGRKEYVFDNFNLKFGKVVEIIVGEGIDTFSVLYWKGEDYVWTRTGDTLFLRDDKGKLVLEEGY